MSTGTLYGVLKRLLEGCWIRRAGDGQSMEETGRVRKAYALTELGRRILNAETERLQALAAVSRARTAGEWPQALMATACARVAVGRA